MWDIIARVIRKAAREVLGVSRGYVGGRRVDRWWNEEVQQKLKARMVSYTKLVESIDEEDKRMLRERYKAVKKEAKLAVTMA